MPCVLHDEEDGDLVRHGEDGGKGNGSGEATELSEWVEEPDLREFDSEMREQNQLGAIPLFGCGGDFLLGTRFTILLNLGLGREEAIDSHFGSCTS